MTADDLPRPLRRLAARAAVALGGLLARWAERANDPEDAERLRAHAARIKRHYLSEER